MASLKLKTMTPDMGVIQNIFPDIAPAPTAKVQDFPMAVRSNLMPVQDFLKIASFPVNRDVDSRLRRAVTRFKEPMIGHAEVAIITYTGPTVSQPAWFRKDTQYCIDGNTRMELWRRYLKGECVGGVEDLPVPAYVDVKEYVFDDAYEAIKAYYTFDSADAVETKGDKITGALRAVNLLDRVQNKKLKKGQVGGALDIACPWKNKHTGMTVPGVNDLLDQVSTIQDQLTAMDKLNVFGNGHFHVQAPCGVAIAAGVIMGEDNIRWIEALETLTNYDFKLDYPHENKGMHPALWALLVGNRENPIGVHNALPYDIGHGQAPGVVNNYLSYCWLQYIDNVDEFELPSKENINNSYINLMLRAWCTE